uniref:GATA-type domain-containing protein n=1 Tax=Kalanchoe fedtschenkoi TaxID=63787 RepID=A0A7N0VAM3_KALFE
MDLSQKETAMLSDETKKRCAMCGTARTPLWRSGPAGPKDLTTDNASWFQFLQSLCNACGIKQRKRKALMCKNPDKKKQRQPTTTNPAASPPSTSTEPPSKSKPGLEKSCATNSRQSVKVGLAAFGKDLALLQRQRSLRRQRSEEEEAAMLLMSLSCSYVLG